MNLHVVADMQVVTPLLVLAYANGIRVDRTAGSAPFSWKTIPQGAATSVWAGIVARADDAGGKYCEDCHVAEVTDGGGVMAVRGGVCSYALDPKRAERCA